jgi:hypothetical protein
MPEPDLIKPDLFSNVFKPTKAQAQSMKPEPNPSPKKIRPDPSQQKRARKSDRVLIIDF